MSIKGIKSNYKGVYGYTTERCTFWRARICNVIKSGYKTEREAAIAVDLILIERHKKPINILVKK